MGYSLADIKTKALIYNTLGQEYANGTFTNGYIKLISFDKTEVPHYNATVDLLMTEDSKVTKASIKLSNNYVEFFDCESKYDIVLNKKEETNTDTYYIKFSNRATANTNTKITLNTQIRKGIASLETIRSLNTNETVGNVALTIDAGYARALPDNYLTKVSGLKVYIDGDNNLIIS